MTRLIKSMWFEARVQWRHTAITVGAAAGILGVFAALGWVKTSSPLSTWESFSVVYVVSGIIVASGQFRDLMSTENRITMLSRPVAAWETVVSRVVWSTVVMWVLVVGALVVTSIVAFVVSHAISQLLDIPPVLRVPWSVVWFDGAWLATAWKAFLSFLPVHAVFFFGGVYFRNWSAMKTISTIAALMFVYVSIIGLMMLAVFSPFVEAGYFHGADMSIVRFFPPLRGIDFSLLGEVMKVVLTLFFWSLSVLRLRETEA